MRSESDCRDMPSGKSPSALPGILLWLAILTGWSVSIFSLVQELCLATACSDTASFKFFGVDMGWLGVAYFTLILLMLFLRRKLCLINLSLYAVVFVGIGAELRLLWIQKYIIGAWCPLCVTICFSLFFAALLLIVEKARSIGVAGDMRKSILCWITFVVTAVATGLAISLAGLKPLI